MLSLFYGPTLTSIHDYWKEKIFEYIDYSFDYTDMALMYSQQSGVFAF